MLGGIKSLQMKDDIVEVLEFLDDYSRLLENEADEQSLRNKVQITKNKDIIEVLKNRSDLLVSYMDKVGEYRELFKKNKKVNKVTLRRFRVDFLKLNIKLQHQIYEEYIIDGQLSIGKKLEEISLLLSVSENQEFEDSVKADFNHQYDKINRQLFYKSIIIELYSFLETKLYEIVKDLERKQELKFSKVKKGNSHLSYLDLFLKYLIEIKEIREIPSPQKLKILRAYRDIRNIIAHKNFNLDESNSNLLRILKAYNSIELENGCLIINSDKLLIDFLKIAVSFLLDILDELLKVTPPNQS